MLCARTAATKNLATHHPAAASVFSPGLRYTDHVGAVHGVAGRSAHSTRRSVHGDVLVGHRAGGAYGVCRAWFRCRRVDARVRARIDGPVADLAAYAAPTRLRQDRRRIARLPASLCDGVVRVASTAAIRVLSTLCFCGSIDRVYYVVRYDSAQRVDRFNHGIAYTAHIGGDLYAFAGLKNQFVWRSLFLINASLSLFIYVIKRNIPDELSYPAWHLSPITGVRVSFLSRRQCGRAYQLRLVGIRTLRAFVCRIRFDGIVRQTARRAAHAGPSIYVRGISPDVRAVAPRVAAPAAKRVIAAVVMLGLSMVWSVYRDWPTTTISRATLIGVSGNLAMYLSLSYAIAAMLVLPGYAAMCIRSGTRQRHLRTHESDAVDTPFHIGCHTDQRRWPVHLCDCSNVAGFIFCRTSCYRKRGGLLLPGS